MTIHATDSPIERYYQLHPDEWEEDRNNFHSTFYSGLKLYLFSVLSQYLGDKGWFVVFLTPLRRVDWPESETVTPDIALFLGTELPDGVSISSWVVGQSDRPAPDVVFEIASKTTWEENVLRKPRKYGRLGVAEYYTYDPYTAQVWKPDDRRLRGWHNMGGQMVEITANSDGSMWSPKLNSRLVPDTNMLRLTNINGAAHVSAEEAADTATDVAERAVLRLRAAEESEIQAIMVASAERIARAEAECKAEARAAKLRELGIDPDNL